MKTKSQQTSLVRAYKYTHITHTNIDTHGWTKTHTIKEKQQSKNMHAYIK